MRRAPKKRPSNETRDVILAFGKVVITLLCVVTIGQIAKRGLYIE